MSIFEYTKQILVTNYLDYRLYLKDIYQLIKTNQPYSYLKFAENLGLNSSNVMHLVITGKRHLSLATAKKIAPFFDLKNEQRRYFLELIALANSRGPKSRSSSFQKIMELKNGLTNGEDKKRFDYFSHWLNPVLREFLRIHPTSLDPQKIHTQLHPKTTVQQIESCLQILKELKIIYEKDGQAVLNDQTPIVLPADKTANQLAYIQMHKEMIHIASESISFAQKEEREINTLTLCLNEEKKKLLIEMIRKFCREALELENADSKPDRVMQLNIQLFPMSKIKKEIL